MKPEHDICIYDDLFSWEGWGGRLKLGSGKCRLRIFDLRKGVGAGLTHLRPVIVIVSDVPESKASVKSCASHVATCITEAFHIDHQRMLFVEYYPASAYGKGDRHFIPERYEVVEFTWQGDKALKPRWRPLHSDLLKTVKRLTG